MTNENLTVPLDKAHIIDPPPSFFYTRIGFKKVHPDAKLPTYAHERDAGMDVCAVEDVLLQPGVPTLVSTGLKADIPPGVEIQVRPRSGLALKQGITVWNGPGTVDSGYTGVIGVILYLAPCHIEERPYSDMVVAREVMPNSPYKIQRGDRIAQLVIAPVTKCEPFEVTEVDETERGTGGFGSSGV